MSWRLEEVPDLAGEAFTAADISVCYALELASAVGACEEYSAAVKSYLERLRDREAFQRARKKIHPAQPELKRRIGIHPEKRLQSR